MSINRKHDLFSAFLFAAEKRIHCPLFLIVSKLNLFGFFLLLVGPNKTFEDSTLDLRKGDRLIN